MGALVIILTSLIVIITIVFVGVLRGCKKDMDNQEVFIQEAFKITGLLSRMFEIDEGHDYGFNNQEWFKIYNELKDMWRKENDKS